MADKSSSDSYRSNSSCNNRSRKIHSFWLGIQGSYKQLQIALFSQEHQKKQDPGSKSLTENQYSCLETIIKNDTKASSHLVPYINDLLIKHNLTLENLDFIAIDKGPGAFTSLRVCIATVNGINFANNIPLVGIDGLEALYQETYNALEKKLTKTVATDPDDTKEQITSPTIDTIVCLLNAYNNDVYYLIRDIRDTQERQKEPSKNSEQNIAPKSCKKIDSLLTEILLTRPNKNIFFTGNAVSMHKDLIRKKLGSHAHIQYPLQEICSAEQVARMGLEIYERKNNDPDNLLTNKIVPNYLKTQYFSIRT